MERIKGEELGQMISEWQNMYPHDNEKGLIEKITDDHRYLQQEHFKFMLKCMRVWAERYAEGRYDARNRWACEKSAEIIKLIDA